MRRAADLVLACLLLAGATSAQQPAAPAKDKPADSVAEQLRPTGPVTVTADRAEWEKGGAMVYTGNVSMSSDTLSMKGDKLELRQKEAGQYEAILNGAPARLDHAGVPGDADAPPVSAEAKTLFFDSVANTVQLSGGAHLTRGTDEITGDSIRYDVAARRIKAAGGEGKQVRIVIQPPPKKAGKP
jgi:lipopolysaccharide export system protein LptA